MKARAGSEISALAGEQGSGAYPEVHTRDFHLLLAGHVQFAVFIAAAQQRRVGPS